MEAQLLEELYNVWYSIESNIHKDLEELRYNMNKLYYKYQDSNDPDDPESQQDFKKYVQVYYYEDNLDILQIHTIDIIGRINMNISYKPDRWTHYRDNIKGILQEHFKTEEIDYFFNYAGEEEETSSQ